MARCQRLKTGGIQRLKQPNNYYSADQYNINNILESYSKDKD